MEKTTRLFVNGRSQAVRIPKAYRFEDVTEVVIRKEGDSLIITPARRNWPSYADEAPAVDEDFMTDRPALVDGGRVVF